jgi:hypothetical protein
MIGSWQYDADESISSAFIVQITFIGSSTLSKMTCYDQQQHTMAARLLAKLIPSRY